MKLKNNQRVETEDGRCWFYNGAAFVLESSPKGEAAMKRPTVETAVHWVKQETRVNTGLAFLPDVIRHYGAAFRDKAKDALLQAANAGLIELRPEGGLNRLTVAEKAACIPGPRTGGFQTYLSYARVL